MRLRSAWKAGDPLMRKSLMNTASRRNRMRMMTNTARSDGKLYDRVTSSASTYRGTSLLVRYMYAGDNKSQLFIRHHIDRNRFRPACATVWTSESSYTNLCHSVDQRSWRHTCTETSAPDWYTRRCSDRCPRNSKY